jgi:hypothetical protein
MIAEGYSAMPSDAPWVDQVDVTEARERAEAGAELRGDWISKPRREPTPPRARGAV